MSALAGVAAAVLNLRAELIKAGMEPPAGLLVYPQTEVWLRNVRQDDFVRSDRDTMRGGFTTHICGVPVYVVNNHEVSTKRS